MADAAPNDSPSQGAAAPPAPPPAAPPAGNQMPAEPVDPRKRLAAWYLLCGHRALWRLPLIPAVALLVGVLIVTGPTSDRQANRMESQRLIDEIKPAPVPDAENAALVYQQAFAARVAYPGKTLNPEKIDGRNFSLFGRPDMQAYFRSNAMAIQLLLTASKMEKCNWNIDYSSLFAGSIPHLKELRSAARLLAAHARWLAHQGDHAVAAAEIATIYRLGHHAATDRVLFPGLFEVAAARIGDQAIQHILLWDTPKTLGEVEHYRNALWTDREPEAHYLNMFRGERASMLQFLDRDGFTDRADLGFKMNDYRFSVMNPTADRDCLWGASDEWMLLIERGEAPSSRNIEIKYMELLRKHQTGPAVIASYMFGVTAGFLIHFRRCADSGRTLEAGLAFLAYRIKYGKDPASLDDLVPEFLKEILVGASDQKTLRMRVDEDGMMFEGEDADELSRKADEELKINPAVILDPSPKPNEDGFYFPGVIRIYVLGENENDDGGYSDWKPTGEEIPGRYYDKHMPDDGYFVLPPGPRKESSEPKAQKEEDGE